RIAKLLAGLVRREREAWQYAGLLVLATIPAAVLGLTFEDRLEALFDDPVVPGIAFLITGLVLWSSRAALARDPAGHPGVRIALLIGVAQAFALVPGISRSGSTVVAALWLGVAPVEAAAFSFLMAIPAIAGAAVLQVPDVMEGPIGIGGLALAVGSLAAAVTGVVAIRTFVAMLRRRSFHQFALYVWVLGVAFLGWVLLR
ncbi:MAG: undecaprenyl-diphosphate phosphatase, partial [Gemmatimonadetes bacterium]|nr:undecaprenyl-diphosphate phosphatase [Gemmatimonadota bacterium]